MHGIGFGITRRGAAVRRGLGTGVLALALLLIFGAAAPGVLAAIDCVGGTCLGAAGNNTLNGTAKFDQIYGLGGNDTVDGRGDEDWLYGDAQADPGLDGDDKLYGRGGDDQLAGYGGSDLLAGGPGADFVDALEHSGHPAGIDTVKGGRGDDEVRAEDGHKDLIDCGPGIDQVWFDQGLDTLANCEDPTPF
jgi:Ca2+-binding RTX toxin-like protein